MNPEGFRLEKKSILCKQGRHRRCDQYNRTWCECHCHEDFRLEREYREMMASHGEARMVDVQRSETKWTGKGTVTGSQLDKSGWRPITEALRARDKLNELQLKAAELAEQRPSGFKVEKVEVYLSSNTVWTVMVTAVPREEDEGKKQPTHPHDRVEDISPEWPWHTHRSGDVCGKCGCIVAIGSSLFKSVHERVCPGRREGWMKHE